MKIVLTGASGLVGSAFARVAGNVGHEVVGIVGRWQAGVPGLSALRTLDLDDLSAVGRLVDEEAPVVVINAAAVAEPAACVADPVRSHRINVDLPVALARVAAAAGAGFIHLSSEQVFDGEAAPYFPVDQPRPLNLYGHQKVESERGVLHAVPRAVIVRLPLLFGNSLGGRRSVHEKLFEHWSAGRPAELFVDEWRQVCTADSVARVLLALAGRSELSGIFHWAGAERVSRFDMGRAIAAHFDVGEKWIRATTRADAPQLAASRPRDLALAVTPLDQALGVRSESLAEAVRGLVRPAWAPVSLR